MFLSTPGRRTLGEKCGAARGMRSGIGFMVLATACSSLVGPVSLSAGENPWGSVSAPEGAVHADFQPEPCLFNHEALPALTHSSGAAEMAATGLEPIRIVLQYYILRRSDGTGGMTDLTLLDGMMRDLNYGFRDTPFVYVAMPDIIYIDSDDTYTFDTISEIQAFYAVHETSGVINIYFSEQRLFTAFQARSYAAPANPRGHTFADTVGLPYDPPFPPHELGHLFWLWHPYEPQFGTECVNRTNCGSTGDLLCDTPASTAVFNGNTTATGIYYGNASGPCSNDLNYMPRTDLYMEAGWNPGHAGYMYRSAFSDDQVARMLQTLNQFSSDLIGPDRPDVLVDCDGDLVDDIDEIFAGAEADLNRDKVLDSCQVYANTGDLLVSGMTNDLTNRPRYYDGQTGAYHGDLWSGASWEHQLRYGPEGHVYMTSLTVVQRMSFETGRKVDNFIDGVLQGANTFVDLLFDANGDVLLLDNVDRNIRRYSGVDGSFLGTFMTLFSTGMTSPKYMEYGPDGHIYIVGNGAQGNTIQEVHHVTGQTLGSFITPGAGGLTAGQGLVFHTDGMLYVSNGGANNVLRYDGITGAFDSAFVSAGSGGLSNPHSLRFGPDGNLYVASRNTNSVKYYDGTTGAYLGDFVPPNSGGSPGSGGLLQPAGLLFVEPPVVGQCCFNRSDEVPGCVDAVSWGECEAQSGPRLFKPGGVCTGDTANDCPCRIGNSAEIELLHQTVSRKNRYLSFTAGTVGTNQALRVSFVNLPPPYDIWNGSQMWVGAPSVVSNNGGSVDPIPGFENFNAATLECSPHYTDWGELGLVHVFHEGIIPRGIYKVEVVGDGCDTVADSSFSESVQFIGPAWGDTIKDLTTDPPGPPDDLLNITDVLAIIGRFASQPGSISKPRADLVPGCLDLVLNITDVLAGVTGFLSLPYPFEPTAADPCESTCVNPLP